jgi:GNAT superfamily N-acetyltransferase
MIRVAQLKDKARVVELLRDSRAGAGFDSLDGPTRFTFPFDPDYAERLFFSHLRGSRMFCLVNVNSFDDPQGVLMATATEHPFGPIWIARETVWWIDPSHRGGLVAVRMLDAYETWAAAQGCKFVGMAGMGNDPSVGALYRRRGYRVAETHFLKPLGDKS